MTLEEFKNSIYSVEKPIHWRKGQFVFNTIDSLYGVARAVQFEDRIDCFFNDSKIFTIAILIISAAVPCIGIFLATRSPNALVLKFEAVSSGRYLLLPNTVET